MTLETLIAAHTVTPARTETLRIALQIMVSAEVIDERLLTLLRDSKLVARKDTIRLPAHRLEGLSRGKGWARKGQGQNVTWGERVSGSYQVGPGRWTVGGNDGFQRKGEDTWTVEHVRIGGETWTVAN